MYIVNAHGILHGWPERYPVPPHHRKAEQWEIEQFQATGRQNTALMTKPAPAPKGKKAKDDDKPAE